MGAPASGKSTWCAENAGDALMVTADAIRGGADPAAAFAAMLARARAELRAGRDVYVDACCSRAADRDPWRFLAAKLRVATRLVVLDTPTAVCRRRDDARVHGRVGRSDVYAARMAESLRAIAREGWGEIVRVDGSR